MQLHRHPKIMKALSRAITHELKRPGELTDYLTYSAIMGGFSAVEKEEAYHEAKIKKACMPKSSNITRRIAS